MSTELKPCPFCGKDVQADVDSHDVIYPSGIIWQDTPDSGRTYHRINEPLLTTTAKGQCWNVVCPTHYGGCGAEISGDSKQEAIDAWNRRAPHPEVVWPEPVAWRDAGDLRAGSKATSYRVVTQETKQGMPVCIAASFAEDLYTRPQVEAMLVREKGQA